MKALWSERSPREQVLLAGAGAVIALVVLIQFVALPLLDYRDAAARSYETAASLLDEVRMDAAEVIALRQRGVAGPAPAAAASVRAVVGRSARARGLGITRTSPGAAGELTVWLDEADSKLLHGWLVALQREHGITVSKAALSANMDAPTVRAQLRLKGGT